MQKLAMWELEAPIKMKAPIATRWLKKTVAAARRASWGLILASAAMAGLVSTAEAATLTLDSGPVPANQAWVDGNQWADSLVTRTLTLPTGSLPAGARITGLTVNVNYSKNDGPNCYNPAVPSGQGPNSPVYPISSGLWNNGACPIEPTATFPNNTTLNNSYPDEIYLAVSAPNGTQTLMLPTDRYVETGGNANYNNIALAFSDAAPAQIPLGSQPASGTFRPSSPFSVFNGSPAQGNWVLTFGDNFTEDPLHILSWGVTIVYDVPPTVTLRKTSVGGVGTFSFAETNLAVAPASITTLTAGTAVSNAPVAVTTIGTAVTVTETPATGFVASNATGVCTDLNGVATGQPGTFGSITNAVLTIPAANVRADAQIRCDFTNTRQPVLRLQKALPNGRATAADQFTVTVDGTGGPISATTTGATNAPTQTAVLSNGVAGATYTLSEVGSGGANLGSYTTTYSCINALAGGQTPSGSGTSFSITPVAADDLTCTFSNARSADLSIVKTANPLSAPTGALVHFTLAVLNAGPSPANGAVLRDAPDAGLNCTQAGLAAPTCTAAGGAACPGALSNAALTGTAGVVVPTLPAGGRVTVTMQCRVIATGTP